MSDPKRHHYLPQFYLRRWLGEDHKLTVYRWRGDKLDIQRRATKSVGSEKELYTNPSQIDPSRRYEVETKFLKRVDELASLALTSMLTSDQPPKEIQLIHGWARFIMSIMHRAPHRIEKVRSQLLAKAMEVIEITLKEQAELSPLENNSKLDSYPTGQDLANDTFTTLLRRLIDSRPVGNAIVNMTWGVG